MSLYLCKSVEERPVLSARIPVIATIVGAYELGGTYTLEDVEEGNNFLENG